MSQNRKKVTEDEYTLILREYEDGESIRSIGIRHGISHQTVSNYIHETDIEFRRGRMKLDDDSIERIRNDYLSGVTMTKLAETHGVSTQAISRYLGDLRGIVTKQVDEDLIMILMEEYRKGATVLELSARHGINNVTLANYFKERGVKVKRGRKTVFRKEDRIRVKRELDRGLQLSEISEVFGCNKSTVAKFVKSNRLKVKKIKRG